MNIFQKKKKNFSLSTSLDYAVLPSFNVVPIDCILMFSTFENIFFVRVILDPGV